MGGLLQVHIAFPEESKEHSLAEESVDNIIKELFLELGLDPKTIQSGIRGVKIYRESQLSVDPGTASLIVAVIGIGIDLIKAALDFYMRNRDYQLERDKLEIESKGLKKDIRGDLEDSEFEYIKGFIVGFLARNFAEKCQIQEIECRIEVAEDEHA